MPISQVLVFIVLLLINLLLAMCWGRPVLDASTFANEDFAAHIHLAKPLNQPRSVHTATLLKNNQILIAGGMDSDEIALDTAEIFDPNVDQFVFTGKLQTPRVGHTATLLADGRVLLVGGWNNGEKLRSVEIFDPEIGKFTFTGELQLARGGHTATLLPDNRVLIAGDENGEHRTEIYNPQNGRFELSASLNVPRAAHSAVLLSDGKVLLTGGGFDHKVTASAEIYDPSVDEFTAVGAMNVARYKHSGVLLNDHNVLIFGGSNERDWRGQLQSAEIFDYKTKTFALVSGLNNPRFKIATAAVKLRDGRILVVGGNREVELFNSKTQTFEVLPDKLDAARFYTTVNLLGDSRVLIVGGYDEQIKAAAKAWIYTP